MTAHPREISLDGWTELTDRYSELARFWLSNERAFVLVAPNLACSPALLGSLLVECAHTAADGYASTGSISRSGALAQLWDGFDQERERLEQQQTEGQA